MMHKWKVSLFLMVGALGLIFLTTGSAYTACPDSITNYWKLDETTPGAPGGAYVDFINGNDGKGNANPAAVSGQVNNAQEFNGTDTGINVPADRSFDWYSDESFSIEYWVKRDDTVPPSGTEVIVGRDDSSTQLHWWIGLTTTLKVNFALGSTTGDDYSVTGTIDVVDGNWHHVVAIRDAATDELRLYVDGTLDNTTINATYGSGFESTSADLTIGWLNLSPFYHFEGMLDEVALYDRALTPAEIQQHYNDGLAGQDYCLGSSPSDAPFPDDTISLWKLDEATHIDPGGNYTDSFNGNDGTGAANPTAATGIVNSAQEFDGATTGIDVPADRSFGWYSDESFSIEYWVKRDDTVPPSGTEVIVGRDDSSTQLHWWIGLTTTLKVNFALGSTAGDAYSVTGAIDVVDGNWHHVVAIKDAATDELRLYVDGTLDNTTINATYGSGFESTSAGLTIGWLNLSPFYHFEGMLDEVALYDRALTPTEIQQHYKDGLAGWGIDYIPVAGFTATPISGVPPLPVNFTDESTGNITSWSWDFGDGLGTSAEQNPTYIYNNAGTYTVSLIVTGPKGTDTETRNDYIVVGDIAPVANFIADPMSGAYPLTVNFTDGSTGNITSWSWDFGDGLGTSAEQNPTYIYNNAGTYTVSLIVTGPDGTDTETKDDYIVVADIDANFTADRTSGERPLAVIFTDGSTGNITSWSWDFGDGLTSTEQNPLPHIYDDAGIYTVSLTVTGPHGTDTDTETKTDYITVSNPKSSGGGGGGCFIATTAR